MPNQGFQSLKSIWRFLSPWCKLMTQLCGDICSSPFCLTVGFYCNLYLPRKGSKWVFSSIEGFHFAKMWKRFGLRSFHGEAMRNSRYIDRYGMVTPLIPTLDILGYVQITGVLNTIKIERYTNLIMYLYLFLFLCCC